MERMSPNLRLALGSLILSLLSAASGFGNWAGRNYAGFATLSSMNQVLKHQHLPNTKRSSDPLFMAEGGSAPQPTTFREAEILGLKAMQASDYEGALEWFNKALTLPGSKRDIVRTQTLSGPSPVGGAAGGRTSQYSQTLDEFEYQAAHYNMACACCCLNRLDEALDNLQKSFEYGFDNYKAVEIDPDLQNLVDLPEFITLLNQYDPKQKRRRNKKSKGPFDFF